MSAPEPPPRGAFIALGFDALEKEFNAAGTQTNVYRAKRMEAYSKPLSRTGSATHSPSNSGRNSKATSPRISPRSATSPRLSVVSASPGQFDEAPPPPPPPEMDFRPSRPASQPFSRASLQTPSHDPAVLTDDDEDRHSPLPRLPSRDATGDGKSPASSPRPTKHKRGNDISDVDMNALVGMASRLEDIPAVADDLVDDTKQDKTEEAWPDQDGRIVRVVSVEKKLSAAFGYTVRPYPQCETCTMSGGMPCPWDNSCHFHTLEEPSSDRTWKCLTCTFENESSSLKCVMCNNERPHSGSSALLDEFTYTEKEYVKHLRQLQNDFYIPISLQGEKILSADDMSVVFCNVAHILEVHAQLQTQLESKDTETEFGNILATTAPKLICYGEYILNLPYAIHKAQKQWSSNKNFKVFLKDYYDKLQKEDKLQKTRLFSGFTDEESSMKWKERFLLMLQQPLSRVPQMKHFLEVILNKLPDGDPRTESLTRAAHAFEDVWVDIQIQAFRGLAADQIMYYQKTKGKAVDKNAFPPPVPVRKRHDDTEEDIPIHIPAQKKQFIIQQSKAKLGASGKLNTASGSKVTSVVVVDTAQEALHFVRVKRGKEVKASRHLVECSIRISDSEPLMMKISFDEGRSAETRLVWFDSTQERQKFWQLCVPASKTMFPFKSTWAQAGLSVGGQRFGTVVDDDEEE